MPWPVQQVPGCPQGTSQPLGTSDLLREQQGLGSWPLVGNQLQKLLVGQGPPGGPCALACAMGHLNAEGQDGRASCIQT